MNKGLDWKDIILAINIIKGPVEYNNPVIENQLTTGATPLSILLEKEQEMIKERNYNNLSDEAKQLIAMVIDCPKEIFSIIASKKTKKISKVRVERFLHKSWKDPWYAYKVVSEVEAYVKSSL